MRAAPSKKSGYILLEVMLAAGIFAMAGIGLATAINSIASTHIQAGKLASIRMELASRLVEAKLQPVAVGKETEKPNAEGVAYTKEVSVLEMSRTNSKSPGSKIPLTGLYRLSILAEWKEGSLPQSEKAELYIYQP